MEKLGGRTVKLLAGTLGPDETVLTQMNGNFDSQTLVITNQRAIIIKTGFMAGQTLGGKVVSFPYEHITSVEVRSSMLTGVFEISAAGIQGVEKPVFGGDKGTARTAPNAIPFNRKDAPKFQQGANLIRERCRQASAPTAHPVSGADEIRKLAELRDSGILTEEEFQAKKTDLLARM
jgi:hypothetical protein